jgi:tetratricopeptide (TPR) repeat protein
LDQARESFESYLRFNPDHADSHFGIGLIDLDADDLEAAKSRFQRSIDLLKSRDKPADPQDIAKARTRLGEVYERQDQLQLAKAELVQATEIFPDNYEGLYKLYRVLTRLDEKDEAERVRKLYLATKERVRPGTSFPE